MVRPVSLLEVVNQQLLIHVCQGPTINQVYKLAKEFAAMVGQHQVEVFDDWLVVRAFLLNCCNSLGCGSIGTPMRQDYDAVRAGLSTEWSNGQTEGQVTRIRLIKRQMYGQTKLDLLSQRVLYRC